MMPRTPITCVIAAIAILTLPRAAAAEWTLYEETVISSRVSGSIKKGHIFKTVSGNLYEVVDYVYLYEYECSPGVVVLRDGDLYRLIIEGFDEPLLCKLLGVTRGPAGRPSASAGRDMIAAAQRALRLLGMDPGESDGALGTKTVEALKRFQSAHELAPNGLLDMKSLEALALALHAKASTDPEALKLAVALYAASRSSGTAVPRGLGSCATGHWISHVSGGGAVVKLVSRVGSSNTL